jgi:D-gamma-glutamyl-meso-diaminopimelic acid endopeptidase CwlS
MFKKILQTLILAVLVVACFAGVGKAEAWSGCGSSYYVQWGDTLFKIASKCGTTMDAIREANPGLWDWVYAGQTLQMPGNGSDGNSWNGNQWNGQGSNVYIVAPGDTLKVIAAHFGTTWDVLAGMNDLYNANVIYVGQHLFVPSNDNNRQDFHDYHNQNEVTKAVYYTAQKGDTLIKIAGYFVTNVNNLQLLNPQIKKSNLITPGDVIRVK